MTKLVADTVFIVGVDIVDLFLKVQHPKTLLNLDY